ncbi:MAG: phosphoribosyl-ATP diphosphatase [Treponema sp.]|jgi:phosphoribosyl-ATP pyrophosphohydrolase/phosphoribosyl-AMP cyclohydrolase|nr:phosphoribosyl-ATP diphosphatase [Treponema sp.]
MVIASIDIQNGKAVQLKQGKDLVLERDNTLELAQEFDRYGEIAVIDLDAAMGVKPFGSTGGNLETIKPLLRAGDCRVGGGIRTAEQARLLVSLGARKIIIGSAAFRDPAKKGAGAAGGEFRLITDFLEELAKNIGKDRIILAVDAEKCPSAANVDAEKTKSGYEITVDGWKTRTGLDLVETARSATQYVSEFLFTCVDREGTMTGIDLEPVRLLREEVSCRVTVAGGVSTLDEIKTLAELGCDVQLGMALYTGKISLADAFVCSLNWKKANTNNESANSLLPVIAQATDGQVLMTGFANTEALAETFKRGKLCFHSRSRNKLWMKGENSGNILKVVRLRADCDRDAILAIVDPAGPVCHTGNWSCFETDRRYTLEYLQKIIADRFKNPKPGSYTATLDDKLVREKMMEEAEELCRAETHDEQVWEAADVFFFATALCTRSGVKIEEVLDELDRRHKK